MIGERKLKLMRNFRNIVKHFLEMREQFELMLNRHIARISIIAL